MGYEKPPAWGASTVRHVGFDFVEFVAFGLRPIRRRSVPGKSPAYF